MRGLADGQRTQAHLRNRRRPHPTSSETQKSASPPLLYWEPLALYIVLGFLLFVYAAARNAGTVRPRPTIPTQN
jgi:hypothetical protein